MSHSRIMTGLLLAAAVATAWGEPTQAPSVILDEPIRHTAAPMDLGLQAADAATIAKTLGEALGATVQVVSTGSPVPPVTLQLQAVSPRGVLDAVAKALHGDWQPIYSVTTGTASAVTRHPRPLGRTVSANLDGVAARAALALVARAGGGTLEISGELPQSVKLAVQEVPVEQALDDLTRQIGASWSVTYLITPGIAPRSPSPSPATATTPTPGSGAQRKSTSNRGAIGQLRPGGTPEGAPFNDPRFFPMPLAPRQPASPSVPGGEAHAPRMLAEGLSRVMQMPPAQRSGAIKAFAQQLDLQFRQIQSLPTDRRASQMAAMQPLFQAAARTYSGLTPAQRGELQPVMDVFSRWMR